MALAVVVPRINANDDELTLVAIHVTVGEKVSEGQLVAEFETTKAVVEVNTPDAGFVLRIDMLPGESVPVGQPMLWLGENSTDLAPAAVSAPLPVAAPVAGGRRVTTKARLLLRSLGVDESEIPSVGEELTGEDVEKFANSRAAPSVANTDKRPLDPAPVGPVRPRYEPDAAPALPAGERVLTNKARELIRQHGLPLDAFSGLAVVRAADVEALLRKPTAGPPARNFRGEVLDPDVDWDAVCDTNLRRELSELLGRLRKRMKAKFNRHVSTNELLHDRWELAKEYGFGEGSSVYDDCLILGDVKVGRHCWIGPVTILDGQGGLTVGDYVDIGAGAQLYSHNTIERALTGHQAPMFKKATTIGNCCFIAPNAIIGPGTVLGNHCFVAAGSYVEGQFPANSYIAGTPAKRIGSVEVREGHARVRLFPEQAPVEAVIPAAT